MKIRHAKIRRDGEWVDLILLEDILPWQQAVLDGWANGAGEQQVGWRTPEEQRYSLYDEVAEIAQGGIVPAATEDGLIAPTGWCAQIVEPDLPEYLIPLRSKPTEDEA